MRSSRGGGAFSALMAMAAMGMGMATPAPAQVGVQAVESTAQPPAPAVPSKSAPSYRFGQYMGFGGGGGAHVGGYKRTWRWTDRGYRRAAAKKARVVKERRRGRR